MTGERLGAFLRDHSLFVAMAYVVVFQDILVALHGCCRLIRE